MSKNITKKDRLLTAEHLAEFERCLRADPFARAKRSEKDSPTTKKGYICSNRWKKFSIAEIRKRNFKIDTFKWLRDESLEDASELPEPEELATEAISQLTIAVTELNDIVTILGNGDGGRTQEG